MLRAHSFPGAQGTVRSSEHITSEHFYRSKWRLLFFIHHVQMQKYMNYENYENTIIGQ